MSNISVYHYLITDGNSRARDLIGAAAAPTQQPQQHGIQAASVTCTKVHSNTGSLSHWVKAGIEPASSWILVRIVTCWATTGTPTDGSLIQFCVLNFKN